MERYRNGSSGSAGRDRVSSDEAYYQGMLKATDGRKGMTAHLISKELD